MREQKGDSKMGKRKTIDRELALTMLAEGNRPAEVARKLGVNRATVCKLLKKLGVADEFRKRRADTLAGVQREAIDLQLRVIGSVTGEEIETMTPSQKAQWADTLSRVMGIAYDKERLDTGQSTANVAGILDVAAGKAMEANGISVVCQATKKE
jgi:predicted transcriptional regulator